MDGRVIGAGSDLVHGLDDWLDEQLVGSAHVRGGGGDLLGEGRHGVLDLDEREFTEGSVLEVLLSSSELGDSVSDQIEGIIVVLNFLVVSINEIGSFNLSSSEVVLSVMEFSLLDNKGGLSV